MSEIASYSFSSNSHSLRIALHLWTPEPEHRIPRVSLGERGPCLGVQSGQAVRCPSQPGPWAAGVLLKSGRCRQSCPGRPRIWPGMRLAGAMSISVLSSPPSATAVSCHLEVVSLFPALEPAQSAKALPMPFPHPCSHTRSSVWVLCHS